MGTSRLSTSFPKPPHHRISSRKSTPMETARSRRRRSRHSSRKSTAPAPPTDCGKTRIRTKTDSSLGKNLEDPREINQNKRKMLLVSLKTHVPITKHSRAKNLKNNRC